MDTKEKKTRVEQLVIVISIVILTAAIMFIFLGVFKRYYVVTDRMDYFVEEMVGGKIIHIFAILALVLAARLIPKKKRLWLFLLPILLPLCWGLARMLSWTSFYGKLILLETNPSMVYGELISVVGLIVAIYAVDEFLERYYSWETVLVVLYVGTCNLINYYIAPSVYCVLLLDAFILVPYILKRRTILSKCVIPVSVAILTVGAGVYVALGSDYISNTLWNFSRIYTTREYIAHYEEVKNGLFPVSTPSPYPYRALLYYDNGIVLFATVLLLYVALFSLLVYYAKKFGVKNEKGVLAVVYILIAVWLFHSIVQLFPFAMDTAMFLPMTIGNGWIWIVHIIVVIFLGYRKTNLKK